jgi:hypothetical protein
LNAFPTGDEMQAGKKHVCPRFVLAVDTKVILIFFLVITNLVISLAIQEIKIIGGGSHTRRRRVWIG